MAPADEAGPDGRSWVESELEPGETAQEHLAVRNLGDERVTFSLTSADGYFTDKGRFNMLPSDRTSRDAGTWVTIEPTVTIDPGALAVVPFTISVPADASPGDHAAGVAASIGSQRSGAAAAVGIESRVGFRVMVRVAGEAAPGLDVVASGTYLTAWNPFQPGTAVITYTEQNTGNVRLAVSGSADRHNRGTDRDAAATGPTTEMLPGDSRTVEIRVPGVWPLGVTTVPVTVSQAAVRPDGTVQELNPVTRDVVVWAMPWPQLLAVLGVVLVAVGLLRRRRRRVQRFDRLLDQAREEGRRQAAQSA